MTSRTALRPGRGSSGASPAAATSKRLNMELALRMEHMDTKLDGFMDEMRREMASLKAETAEIQKDVAETRDIVKAWEAVKTGGKFVKWFGALAAAVVAIIAAVKGGFAMVIR